MNTYRISRLARRVVDQILADRRTLVLIIVMPILLMSFAGILIRSEQGKLTVGVVNQDEGNGLVNLGERISTVFSSFEEFDTHLLTADEAQQQIENGDLDAVITFAPDFTMQALEQQSLRLTVEYEGSNPMLSERLNKVFERASLQAVNSTALANSPATEIEATIETRYLHGGAEYDTLDYMAPALVGFFVFFFVFLLTCISFLRERMAGTLERLQATPIKPLEIILGYMSGFMVFGLIQGAVSLLFVVVALKIHYEGNLLNVFAVEILLVIVSVNLGIFLSTFAQNEFQVLQFVPLVVTTQGLLGGIIWQIEDMPGWLQPIAHLMPLTYANRALREIMINGANLAAVWQSLLVLGIFAVAVILLSAQTAGRARI